MKVRCPKCKAVSNVPESAILDRTETATPEWWERLQTQHIK